MPGYNAKLGIRIIKLVAQENEFKLSRGRKSFTIEKDLWHSVAFKIIEADNYLQVHQWEDNDEQGTYGRAIYSLRDTSDLIRFCDILVKSATIRARR